MSNKKEKVFWFHYNKPASLSNKKPQISVHYDGVCHILDNLVCKVPTTGCIRKRQPYFIMKGKCEKFKIKNGIAIIK